MFLMLSVFCAVPTTRDSPAPGTAHSPPPPRGTPPGGSRRLRPSPHTRRPPAGCGSGRGRAESHSPRARGNGTGPFPSSTHIRCGPTARTHARERTRHQAAHTGSPRRRTARPGPAGPSPDSERGGAGRGRRKSRRTAPTRGEPADPFPPRLPPREVGARGGDSCLRRHGGGVSGYNAHKAGTANGDSDTPHEARPFTDR